MEAGSYLEQLRAAFSVELEERVRALNRELLRLERGEGGDQSRSDAFDGLFREAHSLKGAARAVELVHVEQLAHALESALDDARRRKTVPERAWFDAAYRAVDAFGWLKQSALDGEYSFPPDIVEIVSALGVPAPKPLSPPEAELQDFTAPVAETVQPPAPSQPPQKHIRQAGRAVAPSPATPPPIAEGARAVAARSVATAAAPAPADKAITTESVRVAVSKLDGLLAQVGELTITRNRVEQRLRELRELGRDLESWRREWRQSRGLRTHLERTAAADGVAGTHTGEVQTLLRFTERAEQRAQAVTQRVDEILRQLHGDFAQLGVVGNSLQDDVMRVRLLPFTSILGPLERMIRDLTRQKNKEATLVLEGGETELDRKILEQLRDPLMHMLRNAVDHGIEAPDDRLAKGKPRAATLRLAAYQRGGTVEIELSDDGAGLDPDRLRAAAVGKGILLQEQIETLDDRAALELIFEPGFSTSTFVTDTSGRGVGLDVVREHVERLNGHVRIASTLGQGTCFTIVVPLTLATTRALLIEQGGQVFAMPGVAVERNSRVREEQLISLEGRWTVVIEGKPVPIIELAEILELQAPDRKGRDGHAWRPFLVLRQGDRRVALLVDQLVGEQEIVVKHLGWPLRRVRNVGGAAVLGSGQTITILNPSDVLKSAWKLIGSGPGPRQARPQLPASPAARPQRRLLVVDDSITTRTLERSILEAAGYEVVVATDGLEALNVLRGGRVDLVVSDIEMPRMDGFSLTVEIRRDEKLRQTPVILVTSMAGAEHRERGAAVGADAYIAKGRFDQGELLDTVSRLL